MTHIVPLSEVYYLRKEEYMYTYFLLEDDDGSKYTEDNCWGF